MKPTVNDSCIACGTCEAICPEVFRVEENGGKMIAVVLEADYEALADKIKEAAASCPTQAIEIQ